MSALTDLYRFRKQHPEVEVTVQGARWGVIDSAPKARPNQRPTLLLLPGTMGTAEIFWQQMRALARKVRIIALTYPAVADVARYADGAVRILRQRGIRQAHVLGSSLGGFTAQLVAVRHPEFVQTLFIGNSLCDPHASWRPKHPPPEELEMVPARVLAAERVARIADWPETDAGLALAKAVIGLQGHEVMSARHLKARILALLRAENMRPLPLPDERIVIIDCDDDPVMPPPVRQEVRGRYPGATVHTLPTGGHFPYISRAERYTEILRTHLLP